MYIEYAGNWKTTFTTIGVFQRKRKALQLAKNVLCRTNKNIESHPSHIISMSNPDQPRKKLQ